jgi:hypothetical protein
VYVLLQILVVTVLLLLAQEALRRASRWAVWAVFLLMPLVLTPYWIRVNELGLFSWFKFYTVFFCVCWGTALRFTSLGNRGWARSTIPILLAMNILEAVILDLFSHGPAHHLTAAAGLLLIATLPYGENTTRMDAPNRCSDLLYRVSVRWVIGYTLWNWAFVYLNYPSLAGHHTAVLAAGLIVAMNGPHRWLQARASTLGVNLLFCATFYRDMIAWLDTSTWFDEQTGIVAAVFAFAFMTAYAAQAWFSKSALVEERFRCKVARRRKHRVEGMALLPTSFHFSGQGRLTDLPGTKNGDDRELLKQLFHAVQMESAANHAKVLH